MNRSRTNLKTNTAMNVCNTCGTRRLDSGCFTSQPCPDCENPRPEKRKVWVWGIGYEVKLSAGPWAARSSDGGPYLYRENAIAAAHVVRWQLMDTHGKKHVGRYELQSVEAPVSQPTIEEVFPEKIVALKAAHPGLFQS